MRNKTKWSLIIFVGFNNRLAHFCRYSTLTSFTTQKKTPTSSHSLIFSVFFYFFEYFIHLAVTYGRLWIPYKKQNNKHTQTEKKTHKSPYSTTITWMCKKFLLYKIQKRKKMVNCLTCVTFSILLATNEVIYSSHFKILPFNIQ